MNNVVLSSYSSSSPRLLTGFIFKRKSSSGFLTGLTFGFIQPFIELFFVKLETAFYCHFVYLGFYSGSECKERFLLHFTAWSHVSRCFILKTTWSADAQREKKKRIYLGPELKVLVCATLHVFEGSQVVVADGGRLESNTRVSGWKHAETGPAEKSPNMDPVTRKKQSHSRWQRRVQSARRWGRWGPAASRRRRIQPRPTAPWTQRRLWWV